MMTLSQARLQRCRLASIAALWIAAVVTNPSSWSSESPRRSLLPLVSALPVPNRYQNSRAFRIATKVGFDVRRRNPFLQGRGGHHSLQRHSLLRASSDGRPPSNPKFNLSRGTFLRYLLGTVLGIPILLEAYSRIGLLLEDFGTDQPLPNSNTTDWSTIEHATFVFHGAGGQDAYTDQLLQKLQTKDLNSIAVMMEWENLSSNILQASFNGDRLGRETADKLRDANLKSIHIIGISVGAFAADAMTRQLQGSAFVQLTLLDPFQQKGILDLEYGKRAFGAAADYTQQFLNTDDPVPSTNDPVANAVCYDITGLRPPEIFGHDWPVVYYAQQLEVGIVEAGKRLKSGTVIMSGEDGAQYR